MLRVVSCGSLGIKNKGAQLFEVIPIFCLFMVVVTHEYYVFVRTN